MSDKPLNHLARLDTRLHQARSGDGHNADLGDGTAPPLPDARPPSQTVPDRASKAELPTIDALLENSDWETRLADARARRAEVLAAREQAAEQPVADERQDPKPVVTEQREPVPNARTDAATEPQDAAASQVARLKAEPQPIVSSRPPPRWGLVLLILALCAGAFFAFEFYL